MTRNKYFEKKNVNDSKTVSDAEHAMNKDIFKISCTRNGTCKRKLKQNSDQS